MFVLFKNGEKWLRDDCKKEFTCKNGDIKKKNYKCPDNSACTNGKCNCDAGYEEISDSNNRMKECKKASSSDCTRNGKNYKV